MPKISLSPWQLHSARWKDCARCDLCSGRKHVCLARGQVPAEVVFIGEAPGESEDVLGSPFVGPAGILFDGIVEESGLSKWRCAWTNLVGCIPRDGLRKAHEPPEKAIRTCGSRLSEFLAISLRAKNTTGLQLVVCVGSLSQKWVRIQRSGLGLGDTKLVDVVHPSAILQAKEAQKGLMIQRAVVTLTTAANDLIPF